MMRRRKGGRLIMTLNVRAAAAKVELRSEQDDKEMLTVW